MLILNVIDNGLANDCGVCRVLIMTYHRFCKKYFPSKWVVLLNVLYLVCSIHGKLLFSMSYEDYRTKLSKQVSIYMQIVHNGLFKCSKYTILQLTLKVRQKCNFLLLPSNHDHSKQVG